MSKTVGYNDYVELTLNSRWTWNDVINDLEYIHGHDKPDGKKMRDKNARRGPILHHDNQHKKTGERGTTPSVGGRGNGRHSRAPGQRTPTRQTAKSSGEHTHITLEDIKSLALDMLSEVAAISDVFDSMYGTDQFDDFLSYLLNYFHWFFEKRTQEQKPNPMNIQPSLREIKHFEDLCMKVKGAQKLLGKAYCVLVLGVGLCDQHHMACGKMRVSSTYKDRSMYETFYSFCTFLVWIAFCRREFDVVKKEIGRMLRSETFNPAIRVKNAPSEKEGNQISECNVKGNVEAKMTPAEYRRTQGRRPPIKSIINQRSPALVSILPSPKEECDWLFKHAAGTSGRIARADTEEISDSIVEEQFAHLNDISKLNAGILGQPISLYNPLTLTPLDSESGEEIVNDDKSAASLESQVAPLVKKQQSGEADESHQETPISQVTSFALSDADEDF